MGSCRLVPGYKRKVTVRDLYICGSLRGARATIACLRRRKFIRRETGTRLAPALFRKQKSQPALTG